MVLLVVVHWVLPHTLESRPQQDAIFSLSGAGFAAGAVFTGITPPEGQDERQLFGSWLGSDSSTGHAVSDYFPVADRLVIWVAGYPRAKRNRLAIELERRNGGVESIVPDWPQAGESWARFIVRIPNSAQYARGRILANDGSEKAGGWFGFSKPKPAAGRAVRPWRSTVEMLRVVTSTLLCLVVFLVPGLAVRHLARRRNKEIALGLCSLCGIGVAGLLGGIVWLAATVFQAAPLSLGLVLVLMLILAVVLRGQALGDLVGPNEHKALLLVIVLVAVAVAKGTFALGPPGELYGGSISRTLEVGDRSDARISYHLVQLIAHGESPIGDVADSYYLPWHFTSRGPLPGMVAALLTLASNTVPPAGMPSEPWAVFDHQGFAAYRIAMIAMGACVFLVFFSLLERIFGSQRWALFGMLTALTTPFLVHETYFTWPKLSMAGWVMASAYLLLQGRQFSAGLALGIAYLVHPAALLSAPALGGVLIVLSQPRQSRWFSVLRLPPAVAALKLAGGLLLTLALWRVVNLREFSQGAFLDYLWQADGRPANDAAGWLLARATSILNTLVPGHLLIWHSDHRSINSIHGPSSAVVHFFFQYWNTLPFGFGLLAFPSLTIALAWAMRNRARLTSWLVVVPFALFALYWGSFASGLMREGLHVWMFTLCYVLTLAARATGPRVGRLRRALPVVLSGRALEIFAMLIIPAVVASERLVSRAHPYSDAVCLAVMIAGLGFLSREMYRIANELLGSAKGERPLRQLAVSGGSLEA